MLGKVRGERGRGTDAAIVMIHDLFQRGESTVVHVRRGDRDIAKRRRSELSPIGFALRHRITAGIGESRIQSVVGEGAAREEISTVAVKAVRPAQAARIREAARAAGGHATLFRMPAGQAADSRVPRFDALSAPVARIHQALMHEFDPHRIFDRARLLAGA